MELRVFFSLMFVMYSGLLDAVASAVSISELPTVSSAPLRHVRSKRCSCSSFLDKECVYFCHLDIIWINTPERTVSYGLGSPPRRKRSLQESGLDTLVATSPRCKCSNMKDKKCLDLCQPQTELRMPPPPEKLENIQEKSMDCAGKKCIYNLAANNRNIKRLKYRSHTSTLALIANDKLKTRLLLEKWRKGWSNRSKIWESLMAAS
ncbi:endothelin-1 [Acipenser oxyrinchus oxyrinchus]|uniref:Endothelin-1 n=1 Tax=Acipenser oxyrinchus oxyrinchus TaxID=40147 RepID=A0AAD8LSY8_ACIOX|nr:endothelin-1 [Acipenser oxyrinchus oxyrinchus]